MMSSGVPAADGGLASSPASAIAATRDDQELEVAIISLTLAQSLAKVK